MYVDMRTQTWPRSPGINVATHKSQSCRLSWCSCFAKYEIKSTLMPGARGCAQGPVHCCWLYTCLALLVAVKVQPHMLAAEQHGHPCAFWSVPLACAATRAHFRGCGMLEACMRFAFLYCAPWFHSILAPSARKHKWKMQPVAAQCALSRRQNAYTMGPKLGPQIWKLRY